MARKIIAGTYTFVDEPEKLPQFTRETNILFEDNNGTVINYTTAPISGITTNKFVLAVDRPNETQRYLVYAFEDTTAAGGALSVSKGWYWFNESSTSLDAIPAPSVVFSDNCSINDELTTTEGNALFTTSPIQVQPTVTTTRVLYKGKKELTMAQFEALTSLDDAVDYDIVDFPNGGITNAQMTAALGYSRLFEDGEIYVCSDDGTYKKGNWYQIKVEGGVKSWEDITKGLRIYTITDILNHDSIKSGTFTEEQINNIKLADILQVYAVDGDPVSKYAYKGLYPTNPAQSTIGANLYFVAATEKGNYVLAINTDTRNWEVREPESRQALYKHELVIPYSFSVTDQNTALTWTINDTNATAPTTEIRESINFSVQTDPENIGTNFDTILISNIDSDGVQYDSITSGMNHVAYFEGSSLIWNTKGADTSAYRTITFETAPTGELLTWLQANAVPQSESSNQSSADPTSETTTVNGSVIYHYLSNTGTQITSASEIDDNFLLSGGIGKNSGSDALTWVINEKPSVPDKMFSVKFTSDNIRYNTIILSPTGDAVPGTPDVLIAYHQEDGMFDQVYEIYQGTERWGSQAYRTITFETAPTGELLTWLQANAVPQGGVDSNTVLLFNVNVTKEGSSITVEAVNASTMGYITGTVGTITDTVTQLI